MNAMPTTVPDRPAARGQAAPAPATALALRRYESTELFGARNVILIRHAEQDYVLRVTRNGKLILTK